MSRKRRISRKGKEVVKDIEKASKKRNNNSDLGDDIPRAINWLVAMVIFGGFPIEGGETRKMMQLEVVASMVHLEMKFYFATNKIITVKSNLGYAKRCHFFSLKGGHKSDTGEAPKPKGKKLDKEPQMNSIKFTSEQQKPTAASTIFTPSIE